ncbi:hypothetical protein [Phreatobacter stygius]|uniref:Two pore domain potassium channel family protein n=1 Tax=Phreatobacter stygius TaxID=1940610 RepID=A0A4D7AUN7_9HYPH|nr:hypothetical protein [Phreatobacter stygius]QCI63391.1 hypothetical protein E8M01_03540 [Phreatobacter stygius]
MYFERRHQPLAPRRVFLSRVMRAVLAALALVLGMLLIGMAGYAYFEGMDTVDAFVNAAMILSGMGPMDELENTGAKIFAGCYALTSGLVVVTALGFVLLPLYHRWLHVFHIDESKRK